MRKLASIRKITSLSSIAGADFIELAQVDGWKCIVKKGEFIEGSLGVYFEIDSLLPVKEPYLFLGSNKEYNGVPAYRIKTMRMRKVLSQGLLLPIRYFPELTSVKEGDDVTDILGIIKYEPKSFNGNNGGKSGVSTSKPFPSFIPKTDQERIQNAVSYFDTLKGELFEETLKLDGSSYTAYKVHKELSWYKELINKIYPLFSTVTFAVCSRNIELKDESHKNYSEMSNFWKVTVDDNIKDILPIGYAIQGELIAPNIQSNHEKVLKPELHIFDVFDINSGKKLLPQPRREFINSLGLKHVEIVHNSIPIFGVVDSLDELLLRVDGQSLNKGTVSEGRVYKHLASDLSFKVISNKYLLKEE